MNLEELTIKAGDIELLPSVARKVMELVDCDDVSGNELAEVISIDQKLSAQLLKSNKSAVDPASTTCKALGAGCREPHETLDLVDSSALNFSSRLRARQRPS